MLFTIAVFAPLLGAAIAGLFGRLIGDRASQGVTILCMVVAAACGITEFVPFILKQGAAELFPIGTWIEAGGFHVEWALRHDTLAVVMVAMVTTVSTLIHIYSVGYMAHEQTPTSRFFCYLSLFTFAMLMLVTSDNIVQLFFGWEGVGLMSYLLIGYWYERPSACAAAIKAFVVNRVGDLFFAVGIALIFFLFRSISFDTIFAAIPAHQTATYQVLGGTWRAYEVIGVLLFIGAMGKSAQIFLHTWLPDAMEGPTPVSALIHAATMVTAGVFLVARMSPIYEQTQFALGMVTFIGGTTSLFAATIGCVQNDIKRVIAYSTCSQLGYMFLAAGAGAYQASIFHLFNHAFFKSLLFMCAGAVIHAMSDEQDMRRMGGIWRKVPITYVTMWIGSLALAGIPPFSGYFSKDAILEAAFARGDAVALYGFACGTLAAALTAFYSWRVLLMTFHGQPRFDEHIAAHVHESPAVMTGPLIGLAIGATFTGLAFHGLFIGAGWQQFWMGTIATGSQNHVLAEIDQVPSLISLLPLILALLGIAVAFLFYVVQPALPAQLASAFPGVYRFLLNKWYFDELYDFVFVRPTFRLARFLWQTGDATIIDGVPNGLAALTTDGSTEVTRIQTGSLALYAFVMLIGLVLLVSIFLLFG